MSSDRRTPEDALLDALAGEERARLARRKSRMGADAKAFARGHPLATGATAGTLTLLSVVATGDRRARKRNAEDPNKNSGDASVSFLRATASFLGGLFLRVGLKSVTASLATGDNPVDPD